MKNLKIKSKITIACISLAMVLFSLNSCKKKEATTDGAFSKVKTADWQDHIGEEFTVEGYVDEVGGDGEQVLKVYADPKHRLYDGMLDQSNFIYIAPAVGTQLDINSIVGKKVRITGKLAINSNSTIVASSRIGSVGEISQATLVVTTLPTVIDNTSRFGPVLRYSLCDRFPAICSLAVNTNRTKVAFLYSGGIDAGNAHTRYYNDIKALYWILKNKYGYSDANIIVCYKDGKNDYTSSTPGDTIKIDYRASISGLNAAIADLNSKMGASTKFFCFVNNHGGGYRSSNGLYYGGAADTNGDEPAGDAQHYDEDIYYYNESVNILDDLLATKINSLTFGTGIFVLKPCFSGGLIYDLRGANRVIISSGTERQVTYGHSSGNFGEMSHNFIAAISGTVPTTGATINADTNGDGDVSMQEAFIYLKNAEEWKTDEQPQYNDDGTGTPTTTPSTSSFGAGVFL